MKDGDSVSWRAYVFAARGRTCTCASRNTFELALVRNRSIRRRYKKLKEVHVKGSIQDVDVFNFISLVLGSGHAQVIWHPLATQSKAASFHSCTIIDFPQGFKCVFGLNCSQAICIMKCRIRE